MYVTKNPLLVSVTLFALSLPIAPAREKGQDDSAAAGPAVLWSNPTDIASRNLFYGPGGEQDQPHGPFTFVKEDMNGTNPKFIVRDRDGVKWTVKLGIEARPETVACRITWAVGYYTNEDYFMRDLQVQGMPARLRRGQKMVDPDGSVHNVRLKRHDKDETKTADWQWRHDPFTNTRELNGLKVLMAVMNNWDLKNENNHVYQDGPESIYVVSDLGASFGSAGLRWPLDKAKGNVDSYSHSKFIRRITPTSVDFAVPARPSFVYLVNPKAYIRRIHLEWIGKGIPRDDARWMGNLLASLSPGQIHDAFRAAGYTPQEVERFSAIVARRIAMLTDL
jgi:hypothetical protein